MANRGALGTGAEGQAASLSRSSRVFWKTDRRIPPAPRRPFHGGNLAPACPLRTRELLESNAAFFLSRAGESAVQVRHYCGRRRPDIDSDRAGKGATCPPK